MWSAPIYFDIIVPNATSEFRHLEICFVIPDAATMQRLVASNAAEDEHMPAARGVPTMLAPDEQCMYWWHAPHA